LRNSKISIATQSSDRSPSKEGFEEVELHGVESNNIKRSILEQASMTSLPVSPNRESFEQTSPVVMAAVEKEESAAPEPVVEEEHEAMESVADEPNFNEKIELLDQENHSTERPALTKGNTDSARAISINIPGGWN